MTTYMDRQDYLDKMFIGLFGAKNSEDLPELEDESDSACYNTDLRWDYKKIRRGGLPKCCLTSNEDFDRDHIPEEMEREKCNLNYPEELINKYKSGEGINMLWKN